MCVCVHVRCEVVRCYISQAEGKGLCVLTPEVMCLSLCVSQQAVDVSEGRGADQPVTVLPHARM